MNNSYSNVILLKLLFKWKYHLISISLLSVVVSFIVTLPIFIEPKFKSTAYVYPVNLSKFSGELESEQMLQILESMDIRYSVFKDFKLASHYKIDTTKTSFFSTLNREFENNVSYSKTEYNSVKIEVFDTESKVASQLVDSIIAYYNTKVRKMHQTKTMEVVKGKKILMESKKREIDSLELLENEMRRKYGILDYSTQTERLTEGYIKLISEPRVNSRYIEEIRLKIKNLEDKGGEYLSLNSLLWSARNAYLNAKIDYELAKQEFEKKITYTQIVTSPYPADKKSSPNRLLITFLTWIFTICIAMFSIGVIENREMILQIITEAKSSSLLNSKK